MAGTDGARWTTTAYDAADAAVSVTTGQAATQSITAADGTRLAYARPVTTAYKYDALGRLRQVLGAGDLSDAAYAALNLGHSRPWTEIDYDAAGHTTEVRTNVSPTTQVTVSRTLYRYDLLGRLYTTTEGVSKDNNFSAARVAVRLFGSYAGYLQADALAQYECLYGEGKAKHVCCWAHARRKFVAAHEAGDTRASRALELIGKLYAVERAMPPLLAPSDDPVAIEQRRRHEDQRRATRQRESEGVLSELRTWLDQARSGALPKSPLGSALGYATNNWAALVRYRDEGYLAIDNNLAERTLRAVAVGRNNWGVVGSEVGGQTAATLYSIVGTCKHLMIDPWAYLREALPGLFALGEEPSTEQLHDWLPDRWLLSRTRDRPAANSSPHQSQ